MFEINEFFKTVTIVQSTKAKLVLEAKTLTQYLENALFIVSKVWLVSLVVFSARVENDIQVIA